MKLKFFFIRSLSTLLMLILTLVSVFLALAMLFISSRNTDIRSLNIPFMLFGDELIPLLLFIPALIFRNRICASAAVLVSFFNIFLRLAAIIIFKESSMPLDYSALRLLFDHTDADALKAVLGTGFMWWCIPLGLLAAAVTGYCSILTWKTADKSSRQLSRKSLMLFSALLCLSLMSNLFYFFVKNNMPSNFIVLRPLPLAFYNITRDTISDFYHQNNYQPIPLSEKSRQILTGMKIIAPPASALPGKTEPEKKPTFDRIIIIATESLDYQFIAANNPEMPAGITPNLDRLTKKYPSMKNYFCAAQPTSWGLNALLTSRIDFHRDKYIHVDSVFKLAKIKGFYTCYFSSAPGKLDANAEIYNRLFGADNQIFMETWNKNYNLPRENYWGLSDTTLFNNVLTELKKIDNPRFMAVISTIDTHEPYHNANLSLLEKEHYQSDFLRALHNTDRAIGLFVSAIMEDKKLYNERTLIIVTADHTATFGENYLKRTDFVPERIPLILITPQTSVFERLDLDKYASSIDLPPTLMELIGSPVPESFMGRNLFSDKNCAITWTVNRMISVHSKDGSFSVNIRDTPQNDTQQAVQDFYRAFYGQ